ncbi:MAG: GntR family transcriptional regulator [Duodenibacillus massiliensis]
MTPAIPKEGLFFSQRQMLFEQVSERMGALISNGRWRPGEMLPNEVELAGMFGVSQGTMRRALGKLVDTGVLIRYQGKGTFVAEYSRNEGKVYQRFIRLMPDSEADEALPSKSVMLYFERELPPEDVRNALDLPVGVKTIHAARTLNTAQGLVTHDELWANPEVFEKLTKENLARHEEKMLYAFYQRACGVTITKCEEMLKAKLMPEDLCSEFGLSAPTPVIEIRRTAFTYGDKPVEFHIQRCLTDRYHYQIM